jgi:soluble lytic murein transglycosylase-like protein
MPRHYQIIELTPPAEAQTIERPRSRELVKIFSIIEANRPDIMERKAWELAEVILTESSKYKLDPILILAVIDVESKFQFGAISPAGARGIMQIMPATGKFLVKSVRGLAKEIKADQFTPEHLDNPVVNIKLGTYYLHDLRKSFRNLNEALTAYNVGPTELRIRMENQIEYTDEYANAVLAAHQRFKKIRPPTF